MAKSLLRFSALAPSLLLVSSLVGCGVDPAAFGGPLGGAPSFGPSLGQMALQTHPLRGYNLARAKMARQFKMHYMAAMPLRLPGSVDLRSHCGPVADQGNLGACTGFGIGKGLRETMARQNGNDADLSPLFLYYNERVLEGSVNQDSGATVQDGMKVLSQTGICPETDDPYDPSRFKAKPSSQAFSDAGQFKISGFRMLGSLDDTKQALADGKPVAIGFQVSESFQNIGNDGMMPMPKPGENVLGGHCVCVVGYDDARQVLIVRNSWGSGWADGGYFYMPYAFYTSDNVPEMAVAN